MANLTKEEAALVADTQDKLAAVKEGLRGIASNMRKMAQINRDAGRAKAANDAMIFEGVAIEVRGALIKGHGVASNGLCDGYDDGGVVVFGGGGGRGG